jgi:diguanylate cyclase (GGDEF)-like protein
VSFLFGILVVIPLTGTQIIFNTNAYIILSCIPALIFYPQIVAFLAYALARDLNKTRGTLEQQYQKLAAANIKIRDQRDLLDNISKLDGLTGIPNRRHFDEYLEKQWQSMLRSNSVLALLMIDIDHFKEYNDNYGHGKGDECLKQVAETLSRSLKRPNDMLARYCGDEFICALPGTDIDGAKKIAEQMRQNIMSLVIPHFHSSAADYVTVSLGMAAIRPAKSLSVSRLLKAADQALYMAKTSSRNCVEYLKSA